MIKGIHGLFYSSQPDELRAFIRDKLQLPWTDVGGGWPIYDLAEGDLGVHPTEPGADDLSGRHDISFFTDDVAATVAELKERGVEFDDDVADHGYGLVTHFTMPGGVKVQLYQPKYVKATQPRPKAAPARAVKARPRTQIKARTKVKAKVKAKAKPAAKAAKQARAPIRSQAKRAKPTRRRRSA